MHKKELSLKLEKILSISSLEFYSFNDLANWEKFSNQIIFLEIDPTIGTRIIKKNHIIFNIFPNLLRHFPMRE